MKALEATHRYLKAVQHHAQIEAAFFDSLQAREEAEREYLSYLQAVLHKETDPT